MRKDQMSKEEEENLRAEMARKRAAEDQLVAERAEEMRKAAAQEEARMLQVSVISSANSVARKKFSIHIVWRVFRKRLVGVMKKIESSAWSWSRSVKRLKSARQLRRQSESGNERKKMRKRRPSGSGGVLKLNVLLRIPSS